jgi:hypothetical protein
MSGKFDDIKIIKKPTKKMLNLLNNKGAWDSECSFLSDANFASNVTSRLAAKILNDFGDATLDKWCPFLINFMIFSASQVVLDKLYVFNPEAYMPPEKITVVHFNNLISSIIQDYENMILNGDDIASEKEVNFYLYQM